MRELELLPGPVLEYRRWNYDHDTEQGAWDRHDVTARAHEFIFNDVALADGVTLHDIFKLLDAAPILQSVLRRDFCVELVEEARKGVSPDFKPGYASDAIEYLELYQIWHRNSATKEYQPVHRLDFHGIGYALREVLDEGHGFSYPVGHRIQWGISCSPVRELLPLPVKVKDSVVVCEDDIDAKNWGSEIETIKLGGVSLGQVLHGILWELSFHGGPKEATEFKEELQSRVDEINEGTATLVAGDDFFDEFDAPGCKTLFDSIGEHRYHAVSLALRGLEDDVPVQAGLREALGESVVVKAEHAELPAKAFRRLFREARLPEDETSSKAKA